MWLFPPCVLSGPSTPAAPVRVNTLLVTVIQERSDQVSAKDLMPCPLGSLLHPQDSHCRSYQGFPRKQRVRPRFDTDRHDLLFCVGVKPSFLWYVEYLPMLIGHSFWSDRTSLLRQSEEALSLPKSPLTQQDKGLLNKRVLTVARS